MEELSPDEGEFLVGIPEAVHYTEDGIITETRVFSNMDLERAREVIAEMKDIPLEYVMSADEPHPDLKIERARRMAVAFSSDRWRSSWDPHAPKTDPNLN